MSEIWSDDATTGLSAMVQQPVDNALEISWDNGARYTERWKGPYGVMKGVTANGGTICDC